MPRKTYGSRSRRMTRANVRKTTMTRRATTKRSRKIFRSADGRFRSSHRYERPGNKVARRMDKAWHKIRG